MLSRDVIQQIKDPALNSRWFILFDNVSDPYECVAEQAELSFVETPARSRYVAGFQRYYADNSTIQAVTMTFFETYDYQVTRYIQRWKQLVRSKDGVYGMPRVYKRVMDAQLYHPGRNAPILTLRYTGCWPSAQGPFSVSYDDDEGRIQAQVTFSVDDVTLVT